MRKRNAYLEGYKKEAPFADGLGEFDEARAVVTDLIGEYEEAETESYLDPDKGKEKAEGNWASVTDKGYPALGQGVDSVQKVMRHEHQCIGMDVHYY